MRFFIIFSVLICLAFPVFSQAGNVQRQDVSRGTAATQRINNLSETMGRSVTATTATLADFDAQIGENWDMGVYTSYLRKYQSIMRALQESENKLNLYIRTFDRPSVIKVERDNYESLLKQLQAVKSEFDSSSRSSR